MTRFLEAIGAYAICVAALWIVASAIAVMALKRANRRTDRPARTSKEK